MRLLHRSGVCALALLAGAAILQVEPAIMRDLVLDAGHQRATVGAVRVPLWSAAWAQSPESFGLDNVSFTFGPATFQAGRIELSGVTSSRAEVEALFSPVAATPFAERLSRISARQIRLQKSGPCRHRAGAHRADERRHHRRRDCRRSGRCDAQLRPDVGERPRHAGLCKALRDEGR
jgi:hypothetical protein